MNPNVKARLAAYDRESVLDCLQALNMARLELLTDSRIGSGLCSLYLHAHVKTDPNNQFIDVDIFFDSWPKWSGDLVYPVPMRWTSWLPKSIRSDLAIFAYGATPSRKRSGYGRRMRLDLVEHAIGQVVAYLNETNPHRYKSIRETVDQALAYLNETNPHKRIHEIV